MRWERHLQGVWIVPASRVLSMTPRGTYMHVPHIHLHMIMAARPSHQPFFAICILFRIRSASRPPQPAAPSARLLGRVRADSCACSAFWSSCCSDCLPPLFPALLQARQRSLHWLTVLHWYCTAHSGFASCAGAQSKLVLEALARTTCPPVVMNYSMVSVTNMYSLGSIVELRCLHPLRKPVRTHSAHHCM